MYYAIERVKAGYIEVVASHRDWDVLNNLKEEDSMDVYIVHKDEMDEMELALIV